MFLKEIEWEGMAWIAPTLDRDMWRALVNAVNLRGVIKCEEFRG